MEDGAMEKNRTVKTGEGPLRTKSKAFAVKIVRLVQVLAGERKEFVLSRQLLKSGTSIGANLAEAQCGSSKRDFLSKVRISFKESAETLFWLRILHRSGFLADSEYKAVSSQARTLHAILSATIRTMSRNLESSSELSSEKRSVRKTSPVSTRSSSTPSSPSIPPSSSTLVSPLDSFDPFS